MSAALPAPLAGPGLLPRVGRRRRGALAVFGGRRPDPRPSVPDGGPVVTITADLGTGGDALAAAVADRLGLGLLDHELPALVAAWLGVPTADAQALDGHAPSPLLAAFVWSGLAASGPDAVGAFVESEQLTRFHWATEHVIRSAAAEPRGAVVVGRSAAFVLAGHEPAAHVRLTAPAAWRASQVAERHGIDGAAATALVRRSDRAAALHARRAYGARIDERRHFDLVVDAGDTPPGALADLVVAAVRQRWHRAGAGAGAARRG